MSALDAGDISSSPAGLAAAANGFASSFAKKVKAKQVDSLMRRAMSAKKFLSFLKKFHRRHPARTLAYPGEYQSPPFAEGWESKLGLAIAARLVGHYGLVNNVKQRMRLTLLANVMGLQTARFDIAWKVFVLKSRELNAFGLADGYILITQGLLDKCKGEAEVAAVIAHEIAHVVRYHNLQEVKKRKTHLKAASAQSAMDAAFAEEGIKDDESDFDDLQEYALNAYNHIHKDRLEKYEYEADQLALVYLYRTGYRAKALPKLLKKIQKKRGNTEAYSGHPSFSDRLAAIKRFMAQKGIR